MTRALLLEKQRIPTIRVVQCSVVFAVQCSILFQKKERRDFRQVTASQVDFYLAEDLADYIEIYRMQRYIVYIAYIA